MKFRHMLKTGIVLLSLLNSLPGKAQDGSDAFAMRHPRFSISTNLLYDMIEMPSVGVEVALGGPVSLAAHGAYNWFPESFWYENVRIATVDVEARYWLCKNRADVMRRGQHLGVYGATYRYDFYFGHKGEQANRNWGGGISYGYTAEVMSRLSIDFTVGVGYVGGNYKTYEFIDDEYQHFVWTANKIRHYFGPTKAEISFIWHIF